VISPRFIRSALVVWLSATVLFAGAAMANSFTIPESKLLDSEFASKVWGPAAVVRTDAPGNAVQFAFTGLTGESTGLKDDYPVDTVYGQVLPSHGNGDFSNFDGYSLWVKNLDADPVAISLFINTGFTGPSGDPSNDPTNDTFWQSPWTIIGSMASETLYLDFDNAIPWNVEDNKSPHTLGTNGVAMAINAYDRTEVSAIGFQIHNPPPVNPDATILVAPIPEPVSMVFFGTGVVGVLGFVARRRMRRS